MKSSSNSLLKKNKKSIESHGIPAGHCKKTIFEDYSFPKPQPEGVAQLPDSVYDCIVFFIYCPKHDKIAVSRAERNDGCTWLPFVLMNERLSWTKTSSEGVMVIIGRQDSEMDIKQAEKFTPKFDLSCLHLLRIQTPSRRMITRLTNFIHLNNSLFECCKNNAFVEWHTSSDILRNRIDRIWGPELKIFSSMILSKNSSINCEYTLSDASFYLCAKGTPEQALLKSIGMTDKKIYNIFSEYLNHCYPAFYMCFDSFSVFLERFGFNKTDLSIKRFFHAAAYHNKWYMDFHELLIAIIIIEPNLVTNDNELRQKFIFNSYDTDDNGYLNSMEIAQVFIDMKEDPKKGENCRNFKISLKEFSSLLKSHPYDKKSEILCRSPKSVLNQITELNKTDNKITENNLPDIDTLLRSNEESKNKGSCRACLPKNYTYGSHSIKLDTMARCVEPIIVSDLWERRKKIKPRERTPQKNEEKMNFSRYSLETVFTISSVPNVFLDLISNLLNNENLTKTLFNPEHEWKTFQAYLSILCTDLTSILQSEQKMVRVNAPCLIFSDLQGNLYDLDFLKKAFFPSFPVNPENLIFLGNYCGGWTNSVEVLIYLFSLKVLNPNKVILLRGNYELNAHNAKLLMTECIEKYGSKFGKELFYLILNVFSSMPIAALIDDNIFCTNTGIPKKDKIDHLTKMPKKMSNVEHEQPMAYEILTRYPLGSQKNQMQKSNWFKNSRSSSNCSLKSDKSSLPIIPNNNHSSNIIIHKRSRISNQRKSRTSNISHSSSHIVNRVSRVSRSLANIKKSQTNIQTKSKCKSNIINIKRTLFNENQIKYSGKKVLFLKQKKRKSMQTKIMKSDVKLFNKRQISFDKAEFEEFLSENDISYMIRGNSPADKGFKLMFKNRCISIFSVCNFKNKANQGSIVQVDGASQTLRIIRFNSDGHMNNGKEIILSSSNSSLNCKIEKSKNQVTTCKK